MDDFYEIIESIVREESTQAFFEFNKERFAKIFSEKNQDPLELIENQYKKGVSLVGIGEDHGMEPGHEFTKNILNPLDKRIGLDFLCLEVENFLQPKVDKYLKTGNNKYLESIINREKELVKKEYPVEGRIKKGYFDIIKEAKDLGISVLFVDELHSKEIIDEDDLERRERIMEKNIPKKGRGMFYCGAFHHPYIKEIREEKSPNHKFHILGQIAEENLKGDAEKLLSLSLFPLQYKNSRAINIKEDNELYNFFKENVLTEGHATKFDSLVYHPKKD